MTQGSTEGIALAERARVDERRSADVAQWCAEQYTSQATTFDAERAIARQLGAHVLEDGAVCFGFWAPELLDHRVPDGDIFLELLSPAAPLDLERSHQTVEFQRKLLPVERYEALAFAVVDGVRAGTRECVGDFYTLCWCDGSGSEHRIFDPMASSLPFGAFAPAEVFDTRLMQAERPDMGYYQRLMDEGHGEEDISALFRLKQRLFT